MALRTLTQRCKIFFRGARQFYPGPPKFYPSMLCGSIVLEHFPNDDPPQSPFACEPNAHLMLTVLSNLVVDHVLQRHYQTGPVSAAAYSAATTVPATCQPQCSHCSCGPSHCTCDTHCTLATQGFACTGAGGYIYSGQDTGRSLIATPSCLAGILSIDRTKGALAL